MITKGGHILHRQPSTQAWGGVVHRGGVGTDVSKLCIGVVTVPSHLNIFSNGFEVFVSEIQLWICVKLNNTKNIYNHNNHKLVGHVVLIFLYRGAFTRS